MKKEPTIINYITISGETVRIDTLPMEKRKEIAEVLQNNMMEAVGFERETA